DLENARKDLTSAKEQIMRAAEAFRNLQTKTDAAAELLAKTGKERDKLATDLAKMEQKKKEQEDLAIQLNDLLAKKNKDLEKLAADLAGLKSTLKTSDANLSAAQKHALELEALVREKNKKLTSSMTRVKTLEEQLHDADAQVRNLRVTADTLPAM